MLNYSKPNVYIKIQRVTPKNKKEGIIFKSIEIKRWIKEQSINQIEAKNGRKGIKKNQNQ